jgi:hypothetical protein
MYMLQHGNWRPAQNGCVMKYISVKVRPAFVIHGYSAENEEIVQTFGDEAFSERVLLVERIQSISDQYLLVTSSHGRIMYWEYEGGLDALKQRLAQAGLLVA